ncbi:MAG: hypothetical protein HY403_09745 [Elusimicrobia bacterium]|nr:hypothetical protein [Elusimicrobiota bacterium]
MSNADEGGPSSVPAGRAVEADRSEAIENMRKQLEADPGLLEALVDRIMRSKIAGAISGETDEKKRRDDVRAWARGDPRSAAEVALGLARDEADGTSLFENTLVKRLRQTFRRNNTDRGAYGVLKRAAKTSKLTNRPEQEAGEEEKRELLRTLFEGAGSQNEKVITGSAPEGKAAAGAPAPPALASSFYDRLSAGNIRGYSPQLLSLQSALNARRPPGAPRLIETGTLDHATLSYPAHGLKYDLANLEERLRRARLAELATLGGVRLAESDMKDPDLEARLLAKASADGLPARFAARAAAIGRAKAALSSFEAAAGRSRNPERITKALLVELSERRREAARWLTAAALEEELARVESEEGFLTADLLAAIDAVPAAAPAREAYKRRGAAYAKRLAALKANALRSLDALQSAAWTSRIAEIDAMMSESRDLRRGLSRDISDYRLLPFRIGETAARRPRWREVLDRLAAKYARFTSYGREAAERRGRRSRLLAIFEQVAAGKTTPGL